MDLYVLDDLLRRTSVIDQYESLIWTERFSAYGDFELVIRADRGTRQLLAVGVHLHIPNSKRVMTVETVLNHIDSDGVALMTVTGRSLEACLLDRVSRRPYSGGALTPWELSGTPGDILRTIFDTICRNNTVYPIDNIPMLQPGVMSVPGNIPEPAEHITVAVELGTVYDVIKKLCDMYDMGFRLTLLGDESELYFEFYMGWDMTTLQTTYDPVVFSQELDNLANTSELTSIAQLKNVAYVFTDLGGEMVYPDDAYTETTGFERRVLLVDATDITLPAGPALTAALIQKGKEELAKHRAVNAFDGEIPQTGSYVYDYHYELGDLVETRNRDSLATNMRVTEQIIMSDAEGERSYPTLAIDLLITPGSWYAWDAGQVWEDAEEVWDDA